MRSNDTIDEETKDPLYNKVAGVLAWKELPQ